MNGNEEKVRSAVARLRPDAVAPGAVLALLEEHCKRLGGRQAKDAALSALVLFKLGRHLFPGLASFQAYLADAFQVYSPELLRRNPALSGFLSLSSAYDRVPFDGRTERRLCGLVKELVRRSAKAGAAALKEPAAVGDPPASGAWVGALGNLSNGWFERDPASASVLERLGGLPHFVRPSDHAH